MKKFIIMLAMLQMSMSPAIAGGASKLRELSIEDTEVQLLEACSFESDCSMEEMIDTTEAIASLSEAAQAKVAISSAIGTKRTGLKDVFVAIKDTGVKVTKATLKVGRKTIVLVSHGAVVAVNNKVTRALYKSGKKVAKVTFTVVKNGVTGTVGVTFRIIKRVAKLKPISVTMSFAYKGIKAVGKGTHKVIKAVFKAKPIVVVVKTAKRTVRFVVSHNPVKKVVKLTFKTVDLVKKGVWKTAKFAYKGAAVIVVTPIRLLGRLLDSIFN